MTQYKKVDGVLLVLTDEEETAYNQQQTDYQTQKPTIDLGKLRAERDRLLTETDWWAGSDLTMTQAQTDYRQALRDITDNATSLDDVTWPTKP